MNYVALLRGINVGTAKRVAMQRLRDVFESHGFVDVKTYINSGNVLFSSKKKSRVSNQYVTKMLKREFGFDIASLVKTHQEMQAIAKAIPRNWTNDANQKTDIAYLFPEYDTKKIIRDLPVKKEYVDIRYIPGALLLHVDRKNLNKSQLNKLVGHSLYKGMTLRNVNTARFLGDVSRFQPTR